MRRVCSLLFFSPLLLTASVVLAQAPSAPQAARDYTSAHRDALIQQYESFLAMPNVAADPHELARNADFLLGELQRRGATAQLLTLENAPPVVFGEFRTPGAQRTIVFYAHYDGQPVTPSEWATPPFTPTLKTVDGEPRLYARSAADDKAAIFAQLTALDALKASGIALKSNIRFVWEGEEEANSPHLAAILAAHSDLVHGDVWLVCDSPVDQSGRQSIVFGARGNTHLEITVYGPNHGLHSGHYGNWAPNPALELARLLAAMKNEDGRVLIPHFYDGVEPLSAAEKAAIAQAPLNDPMLMKAFALGRTEGGGRKLLDLINEPSLNINGMASGQTGAQANNIIPPTATADLDLRLVVGLDWQAQQKKVVEFVRSQGYFVVDHEPTAQERTSHAKVARVTLGQSGYNAVRTPLDLPIARDVVATVKSAQGEVVLIPTMGASVPLGAMEQAAHTRTITIPIANFDDNQHTANENLRLKNLWDGVATMAALIDMQ